MASTTVDTVDLVDTPENLLTSLGLGDSAMGAELQRFPRSEVPTGEEHTRKPSSRGTDRRALVALVGVMAVSSRTSTPLSLGV
jgi:hypothetical protein